MVNLRDLVGENATLDELDVLLNDELETGFDSFDKDDIPIVYEIGRRYRESVGRDYDSFPEAKIFLSYLQCELRGTFLPEKPLEGIMTLAKVYFKDKPSERNHRTASRLVSLMLENIWWCESPEDRHTSKSEILKIVSSVQRMFWEAEEHGLKSTQEPSYHFTDGVSFISRLYDPTRMKEFRAIEEAKAL